MTKIDWSKHRFKDKKFERYDQPEIDRAYQNKLYDQIMKTGKITFGKYKGTLIKKLDTGYLNWLIKNVKHNDKKIIKAQLTLAREEYHKRLKIKIDGIHRRPRVSTQTSHKVDGPDSNTVGEPLVKS